MSWVQQAMIAITTSNLTATYKATYKKDCSGEYIVRLLGVMGCGVVVPSERPANHCGDSRLAHN